MKGIRSKSKRAQSTLEFTYLALIIIAALLAMQIYMKRGMEGRYRAAADQLGAQYAPEHTTSTITMEHSSLTKTTTTSTEEEVEGVEKIKTETYAETLSDQQKNYGEENLDKFEDKLFD